MSVTSATIPTTDPTINTTVEATVPETGEKLQVKLSGVSGKQLKNWAKMMRARYDSAQTTDDNRRHWANADDLSANAANSPAVRLVLRKRSRYETANNSYAKGMTATLANHTVGTGPRIQITDRRLSKATRRWLQDEFTDWMNEIGMGEKLRTMRKDKCQSGEGFAGLVTNYNLDHPVKLDLRTIECDRVADPNLATVADPRNIDGVMLDAYNNPTEYRVLRYHPGDLLVVNTSDYETVDQSRMCHWFTSDRSGQYRGIPEFTPALPLFAQLRRFTLAVIAAAEAAAAAAGVLQTDAPAGEEDDVEPMDTIEFESRMMITLPKGWEMKQVDAKQPTTTYAEFKREILKEIARCIQMPYNIAAGDSSDYNFASGKLDCGIYITAIWIDQDLCEKTTCNKTYREFYKEARLIPDYFPDELRAFGPRPPRNQWHWDAVDLNDGVKRATERDIAVKGGWGNLKRIAAEDGLDFDEELEQQADALGVSVPDLKAKLFEHLYGDNAAAPVQPASDSHPAPRSGGQRVQPN